LVENVSLSEAHVSNVTGVGLAVVAGAANSVKSCQIKASEFSVLPSTAPALAGTATTTAVCLEGWVQPVANIRRVQIGVRMVAQQCLVIAFIVLFTNGRNRTE